jgi:hypothetical protein
MLFHEGARQQYPLGDQALARSACRRALPPYGQVRQCQKLATAAVPQEVAQVAQLTTTAAVPQEVAQVAQVPLRQPKIAKSQWISLAMAP